MMCYEQAMKQDSQFPLPYVGLADALIVLGMFNLQRPRDVFPRAKTAAERALAIDAALAEAHGSLGYIAAAYDWDWESAERHLMRALTLGPRSAVAHHWYAIYLNIRGRFAESINEALRCVELEPLSSMSYTLAGQMYMGAGCYPEAVEQLRKALELDVYSPVTHVWLAATYLMMKRPDDAMEASANLAQTFSASSTTAYIRTHVFIQMGRLEEARRVLAEAEKLEKSRYLGHMSLALAHAGLGEMDAAVERLERAFEEREPQLLFLKQMSLEGTEALLAHPKVQALMKNAGLSA
jgi:tetratricopeptide (TPR) repeat protein